MTKKFHLKSDSKLAIILKKMAEDKVIISKYLKGEITKKELDNNGIKLVMPINLT